MAELKLRCPNCGASNTIPADELDLECETISYTCVCENCGNAFAGEEPYWRWIGLEAPPADEKDDA
jgi:hypothetical protein